MNATAILNTTVLRLLQPEIQGIYRKEIWNISLNGEMWIWSREKNIFPWNFLYEQKSNVS